MDNSKGWAVIRKNWKISDYLELAKDHEEIKGKNFHIQRFTIIWWSMKKVNTRMCCKSLKAHVAVIKEVEDKSF